MVELGSRRTTERVRVGNSPPTAARAVFLPDVQVGAIRSRQKVVQLLAEILKKKSKWRFRRFRVSRI